MTNEYMGIVELEDLFKDLGDSISPAPFGLYVMKSGNEYGLIENEDKLGTFNIWSWPNMPENDDQETHIIQGTPEKVRRFFDEAK